MAKLETLKENLERMIEKRKNLELAIELLEQKIQRKELHEQQVSLAASKKPTTETPVSEETEQDSE